MFLRIPFFDIAGTPADVPFPGVWNGSLWTLQWEFLAYIALAVLGLVRLLRYRWVSLLVLMVLWLINIGIAIGHFPSNYFTTNGARFGFMFVCGMVIYVLGKRLPAAPWVPILLIGVLAGSVFLDDYRLLGGPALAWFVIWLGGAVRRRRWQLKDRDVSYGVYIYAFPLQQLLATLGLAAAPPLLFGLVGLLVTVPLAIGSWLVIEKPALRLKRVTWHGVASGVRIRRRAARSVESMPVLVDGQASSALSGRKNESNRENHRGRGPE